MKKYFSKISSVKQFLLVFTSCCLIFLGISNIKPIIFSIMKIFSLFSPLLTGLIFAIVINIPMNLIEYHLFTKYNRLPKVRRPLSIALSLLFILGGLIGIAFLVVPELINAVAIILQNVANVIDFLAEIDSTADLSDIPYGNFLQQLNIDWGSIKASLERFSLPSPSSLLNMLMQTIESATGLIINLFVGLVFSVYILSGKEKLKHQVLRMIHAWLPFRFGKHLIHVTTVCTDTFRLFMVGQITEAVILGTLCTIGMFLLGLPYAPMISATIGVTALIPVAGAYIGAFVGAFMILTVSPFKSVIFLIFILILQQLEGNLIYPKVVGKKLNLPAIWVLAAITIGGSLNGPVGMLLGVPAAAAAYALLREATEKQEEKRKVEKNENRNY